MNKQEVVFGDKDSSQYVEFEFVNNNKMLIHWMDFPREIVYSYNIENVQHFVKVTMLYKIMLEGCRDITDARFIIENNLSEKNKSTMRTRDEVYKVQQRIFDYYDWSNDDYFAGAIRALDWVLGEKWEEFENVQID